MEASLVMFKADGERREFPLTRDETIVGRKSTCDLRIPLSSVSRQHFKIEKDGEDLILQDLGSSNGTFYNGERVMEADLEPGDQIRVGPVTFVVVVDGEPDPDSIEPVKTVLPAESGEIEAGSAASAAERAESVGVHAGDESEEIEDEAMTPTIEVDAEAPSESGAERAKPPAAAAGTGGDDAEDEAFAALNEDEDAEEDEEAIAALEALAESDEDDEDEEEETPIPLIEEDEDEEKQK